MARDLSVAIRLLMDSRQMRRDLKRSERGFKGFSSNVKSEAAAIRRSFSGIIDFAAGIGLSIGAVSSIVKSARLDKTLTRIQQSAQGSRAQVDALRDSIFLLSAKTGQSVDTLQKGFESLTQSGLTWVESTKTLPAINDALAVTGANIETLSAGLTVGAKQFGVNLAETGAAADLLDKFTLAGRLANAEIEDLSGVFSRVGVNAMRAGLDMDQTLAVVESFSKTEKQPERLATLVDSTLRLFTNSKVRQTIARRTGIQFFDAEGSRRDAISVLEDIERKFKTLKSDLEREKFIEKVLPNADLDTKKGFSLLLGKGNIAEVRVFTQQIKSAGGTIKKDLDGALNNAVSQTGRLKGALGAAADAFARPINEAITKAIKFALDSKDKGGLGLSSKEILAGGAGLTLGAVVAGRFGGKALKSLGSKAGGLAGGLATGKALEQTAGVQPVFVVNMPGEFGGPSGATGSIVKNARKGSIPRRVPKALRGARAGATFLAGLSPRVISGLGPAALGTAGAGVAGAGLVGTAAGTLITKAIEGTTAADKIGEAVARALAAFGNQEAKIAVEIQNRSDSQVGVKRVTASKTKVRVSNRGLIMGGIGN